MPRARSEFARVETQLVLENATPQKSRAPRPSRSVLLSGPVSLQLIGVNTTGAGPGCLQRIRIQAASGGAEHNMERPRCRLLILT